MRIYLDNCCFNRPFDDQAQLRIKLEAEAKLKVQEDIRSGIHELIWSYVLDYENSKNPFRERQEQIGKWQKYAIVDVEASQALLEVANKINLMEIKEFDSLHLACAVNAGADCFLTTDDGILKKVTLIESVKVTDPIGFIKEV